MSGTGGTLRRGLPLLGAAGLAALIGWAGWQKNLVRSCLADDWPKLDLCASLLPPGAKDGEAVLRARIAANPGDGGSYMALALLSQQPGTLADIDKAALVASARKLAGNQPELLYLVANKAIEEKQWDRVAETLIQIIEDRKEARAANLVALLIGMGSAEEALLAHVKPGTTWLAPVLAQLPKAGVPAIKAMPLVARALPMGLVTSDLGLGLIRDLKAGGAWHDAYALWARLLNRPVDLVYNGKFENDFIRDGFDWEVNNARPSRAGVLFDRPQAAGHGRVLELEFTRKSIEIPMVRQYVLLNGSYTFSGQFMMRKLRSREGLAWTFTCVSNGREFARSPALKDTGGKWLEFSAEIKVPADCGPAVALDLQTQAPYEATAGISGEASFDDLRLAARDTHK